LGCFILKIFSLRLKWLREKIGKTQKEMSELLGISQTYYGRFEKNTGEPNLETLLKIKGILKESIDFMIGADLYDQHARNLMRRFFRAGDNLKTSITKYNELTDYFNSNEELDINKKIDAIVNAKQEVENRRKWYKKRLDEFIDYLNTIPMLDENRLSADYWIDHFDELQFNNEQEYIKGDQ
jgi:transcriptional regulator with XRE-family HTH domain